MQALGIFALIAAAHFLARSGRAGLLRLAGEYSLAIYVMHRSLLHIATQIVRVSPPPLKNAVPSLLAPWHRVRRWIHGSTLSSGNASS